MRKRGLSETIVWAYNPLPPVTEAELLLAAELESIVPDDARLPFAMDWQFAGGLEREDVTINPGEFLALRESESTEIERELAEKGLVIVRDRENRGEVLAAAARGLRTAATFWRERGATKLSDYRKRHGASEQEMQDRKYELWAYHMNAAKAAAVEAHRKAVDTERAALVRAAGVEKGAAAQAKAIEAAGKRADRMEAAAGAA